MQRCRSFAFREFESDEAHFFVDQAVRGEDDRAPKLIRRAEKIADFSAGLFNEDDPGGSVPTF